MKNQLLALLSIALLTRCVSTKNFTAIVEPKFQQTKAGLTSDKISFDLSGLDTTKTKVTSTKVKSQFIPAILYWEWNNTIKCEVNPIIMGQAFQKNFLFYSDSLKVQEKLQDRKLEIKVDRIPNSFVYTNKGNALILIVAYTVGGLEAIFPQEENLVVNYKLTQDGSIIKEGKLTTANKNEPVKNEWKSTKNFTRMYVDQFKQTNKDITKEIVEKLIIEL